MISEISDTCMFLNSAKEISIWRTINFERIISKLEMKIIYLPTWSGLFKYFKKFMKLFLFIIIMHSLGFNFVYFIFIYKIEFIYSLCIVIKSKWESFYSLLFLRTPSKHKVISPCNVIILFPFPLNNVFPSVQNCTKPTLHMKLTFKITFTHLFLLLLLLIFLTTFTIFNLKKITHFFYVNKMKFKFFVIFK